MAVSSIYDFSVGRVSAERIPENAAPYGSLVELRNARVDRGDVRSFAPLDKLWTFPENNRILGVLKNPLAPGFFIAVNRGLYYGLLDGTYRLLRSDSFSGTERVSMTVLNAKLFTCDGVAAPRCYNIEDMTNFQDLPISKATGTWFDKQPAYAITHLNRVWLILKESNEVWGSTFNDAQDWNIVADAADSAQVFISTSPENSYISLLTGLESLMCFKEQGIDFIVNGTQDLFDVTEYLRIPGAGSVTTYNAWTTLEMTSGRVYTIGKFGIQVISRESLTNRLTVKNIGSNINPVMANGFPRKGLFCNLLASQDNQRLLFDITSRDGKSFTEFDLERDTIVSDLTIPDLHLFTSYQDEQTGAFRYIFSYNNEVWVDKGREGFPGGAISMKVKTPFHALGRGAVVQGGKMKLRGKGLGTAQVKTYWNGSKVPTDEYELQELADFPGRYAETPYGELRYAGGEYGLPYYETLPLFGSGDQFSMSLELQIKDYDAILQRVEIEHKTRGFTQNG